MKAFDLVQKIRAAVPDGKFVIVSKEALDLTARALDQYADRHEQPNARRAEGTT
jgi:hypothetical protein